MLLKIKKTKQNKKNKKKNFSIEEYKAGHPLPNKSFIDFTDHFESVKLISPRDYKGDREGIPHIHPIP